MKMHKFFEGTKMAEGNILREYLAEKLVDAKYTVQKFVLMDLIALGNDELYNAMFVDEYTQIDDLVMYGKNNMQNITNIYWKSSITEFLYNEDKKFFVDYYNEFSFGNLEEMEFETEEETGRYLIWEYITDYLIELSNDCQKFLGSK